MIVFETPLKYKEKYSYMSSHPARGCDARSLIFAEKSTILDILNAE